ncbi:MAG TPA: histidine phosphatase family protein [Solirubrobacteraceae bacterium]|nr:histidine phosphatase family protein [Solirubrobacteraceae bacterium]
MARQLWLLRHAEAEPHGTRTDAQRRLTARGEGQARAAGLALVALGAGFDSVLFSPKVRAKQTAELAGAEWSKDQCERLQVHPPLAGGFDVSQALARLAVLPADGRLLLVGHEPDLSGVIGNLIGGRVDLKKGGLAVVRLDGSPAGPVSGELTVLLRPRELALIAGLGVVPIDGN